MLLNDIEKMLNDISDANKNITSDFINSSLDSIHASNPSLFTTDIIDFWKKNIDNANALGNNNLKLLNDYLRLIQYATLKNMGQDPEPVISPQRSDRRFKDEGWNEYLAFDYIKQFYLLASQYITDSIIDDEQTDDKRTIQRNFFIKQWLDALSPTNFAASNPAVMKETIDTQGKNLIEGAQAFIEDLKRGKGEKLLTRMTDYDSFEVGKNIATTPGKIVFQNELMQLIQYEATTKTVYETPLLIVPPWINKYYILDLKEENSFIKWAVDQGHTVFIISWKNPDESYADTELQDYMTKGILTAVDKAKEETGEKEVNAIGYCIGGTLLAATNAYLASKRRKPIKSVTYFTTLVDFEDPGDLGVFIDELQLNQLDEKMSKEGYLDGSTMAAVFNMLRANDLIWPFFINNYLLGKEPMAFDLLYWNSDSTRLPAKTHSFYLRQCYLNNALREPGGIELDGTPIDLSKIKIPTYFISTLDDHITPWKSTYAGTQLMSGPVRFVLGGSGHIAGIVNPPVKNKYNYWTNDKLDADPDNWLDNAKSNEGSWWPDWQKWIKTRAGKKIPARKPGKNLKVLEDAPGSYVKERIVPD